MFNNECLGELDYEATTAAIFMAGMFLTFVLEYTLKRISNQMKKSELVSHPVADSKSHNGIVTSASLRNASTVPTRQHATAGILVLEAGMVVHSLSKFHPRRVGKWRPSSGHTYLASG